MALVNIAKPTTALVNTARVSFGETWNTIITTWNSETRTWDATGSLFTNIAKQSSVLTNISKPA